MSEPIAKLKSTLAELESELASLDAVDVQTREMLEQAMGDIQRALEENRADEIHVSTYGERLRESAEEFESSHPTLFGIVSRMIDALGQMGI